MINLPSRVIAAIKRLRKRFGDTAIRRATNKPIEKPAPKEAEKPKMSDSRQASVLAAASDIWQHTTHLKGDCQRIYVRTGLRKLGYVNAEIDYAIEKALELGGCHG
jgi:hypothetical protein